MFYDKKQSWREHCTLLHDWMNEWNMQWNWVRENYGLALDFDATSLVGRVPYSKLEICCACNYFHLYPELIDILLTESNCTVHRLREILKNTRLLTAKPVNLLCHISCCSRTSPLPLLQNHLPYMYHFACLPDSHSLQEVT